MTPFVQYQAISASAGSGKTFQLAHRFIRLLSSGVAPDRMIALTFSRKAAGEMFDSILGYIWKAAQDAGRARKTAADIGCPGQTQEDFTRHLRNMTNNLHRLHIGTLDSFAVGVLRAFPMEFGVAPDFEPGDTNGTAAFALRDEALRRILSPFGVRAAGQQQFVEAYKQATFGEEGKSFERRIGAFLEDYRRVYRLVPESSLWGMPETLWGGAPPWRLLTRDKQAESAVHLRTLVEAAEWPDKVARRWVDFARDVAGYGPGSEWSSAIDYLFLRTMGLWRALATGEAEVRMDGNTIVIPKSIGEAVAGLLGHVMATRLLLATETTQGIFRILDQYEHVYEDLCRRHGILTFEDIQYVVAGAPGRQDCRLSRNADSRLFVDYRLDAQLDHWLLDEFQDTSDLQWMVLANLADEVFQDAEGRRSFFYVGDVKQAIHSWRGGNPRLFECLSIMYPGLIKTREMVESYRSSQPVIDTLNRVFADLPAGDDGLPEEAVRRWNGFWDPHTCAVGAVPATGCAAILEPRGEGGELKSNAEDRYRVVGRLLREMTPIRRGLSTAVLVRTNEHGRRVVDVLRQMCHGMSIVHEGRSGIVDNPVVSALLSLIRCAWHPGDDLAWREVQMGPLGHDLEARGLNRSGVVTTMLRELDEDGYQRFLRRWGARLHAAQPLDEFGQKRLRELVALAGEFDNGRDRDAGAFLDCAARYERKEVGEDLSVRVMTIHQSKGLGFDIVILPDLSAGAIDKARDPGLLVARDAKRQNPVWTLQMPPRKISEHDSVLDGAVRRHDAAACVDELCVLYVALTRARQGLYAVTSYPGKSAEALDASALVKHQLVGEFKPEGGVARVVDGEDVRCLYSHGDWDWFRAREGAPEKASPVSPALELRYTAEAGSGRRPLPRVLPSSREAGARAADGLFSKAARDGRTLGLAVHGLLQRVGWLEGDDIEATVREWERSAAVPAEIAGEAAAMCRRLFRTEAVREAFRKPAGQALLWREMPYDIVLSGERWVSGVFDRVILMLDANGRVREATVLDFKSDRVDTPTQIERRAGEYRPQLELYRDTLCTLLSLPPAAVNLRILFTQPGRIVGLD